MYVHLGFDEPDTEPMTDCANIHGYGLLSPGIYKIKDPKDVSNEIHAYCHDGWTVILSRGQLDDSEVLCFK